MDSKFMARALELAAMGEGLVSPNPLVGAVVARDGRIVGEGFHQFALLRHAESYALEMAGAQARGATLYCNLEPCCHQGRTPPCTDTLIEAGIGRVVVAIGDPDPRVNHRGFDQLATAGVDVHVGVMSDEASRLNEIYLKHSTTGRAFVHLVSGWHAGGPIGGEGYSTAGLPSEWRPSPALRRSARRYDALVLGDASPPSLAIANEYVAPLRHRTAIVAGYAAAVDAVKDRLRPEDRSRVCFVVMDDIAKAGPELPALDPHGDGDMDCHGWVALDRLIDSLAGERVTSALVLAGRVNPESDLGAVDKITLVLDPREAAIPEQLDLKGFGASPSEGEVAEPERFVEISSYPARR